MIITIYPRQLIVAIHDTLRKEFSSDHILYAELDSVVTGFQNSLCWSVLRHPDSSEENPRNTVTVESTFESEWMTRKEIIARIADTSGLTPRMSAVCLRVIENTVRQALTEAEVVALEPICLLRPAEDERYEMELQGPFRVQPFKGMAHYDDDAPAAAAAGAGGF